MKTAEREAGAGAMPFIVRPMNERDIPQAREIERDAFPSLFPPTPFRRELGSHTSSYLVACLREDADGDSPLADSPAESARPFVGRLVDGARDLWRLRPLTRQSHRELVVGFIGVWYVVDQAHIVSVGVRSECRSQGVGELLLISAIEQAMGRASKEATLEVRVSNHAARNLYQKYGFKEHGTRRGYYSDNQEDALIMTTDPICMASYSAEFGQLVQAHERRWGQAERHLP